MQSPYNIGLTYNRPTYTPILGGAGYVSSTTVNPGSGGSGGSGGAPKTTENGGAPKTTAAGGTGGDQAWTTFAGGVGTAAGGLADLFTSGAAIERQRGFLTTAQDDIDKFYGQLEAGDYDRGVDPKLLQFFSMGRRGTDLTPTLSAMATGLDAASADPRVLSASIPGMTSGYSKTMQDIARQDFERELSMKKAEGETYQNIADSNLALRQQIFMNKLAQDQAAYAQAQQNIEQLRQARAEAPFNIISGAAQAYAGGSSAGLFGEDGVKIPKYNMGGDVMAQIMSAQDQEGVPPRQDLPGPESHEDNPIDMIAPNGEKVGEATGGEIILNSEQTDKIEDAVDIVDETIKSGGQPTMEQLMAVYEAVSETLSQPQFQDEGESKKDEMRSRMEAMLSEQ